MVVLKLEVGADGAVDAAVVQATTSGVSRPMASAAVEAAQQWRFAPELVAGQAVPSTMLWPVCYVGRETSLSRCSWSRPGMPSFSSKTLLPLDSAATLVSQRYVRGERRPRPVGEPRGSRASTSAALARCTQSRKLGKAQV